MPAVANPNFDKVVEGNGLGPRTLIVKIVKDGGGNVTEAVVNAFIKAAERAGGDGTGADRNGPDAFTVAGVTGVGTAAVYLALQGTGTLGATAADHTVTTEVTFDQREVAVVAI
jgi:hypothetical protein